MPGRVPLSRKIIKRLMPRRDAVEVLKKAEFEIVAIGPYAAWSVLGDNMSPGRFLIAAVLRAFRDHDF